MLARTYFRTTLIMLAVAIMLVVAPVRANDSEVTIGVYNFPPIAAVSSDGKPEGFLADLLTELGKTHPDVSFRIFHTSPKRRHLDFDAGLYDIIFFESPGWGWSGKEADITPPVIQDEEVYVALQKPGRDVSFFNDLQKRSIVAISGYHYGFFGYETDNNVLAEKFNIEFSESHSRNIKLIKADRPSVAEVAIISRSYLQRHLELHPEDREKLLISPEPDQRYRLSIVARRNGPASANEMIEMLAPLVESGTYRELVKKWGLQLPTGFLTAFDPG